jgi:hypothetical protein
MDTVTNTVNGLIRAALAAGFGWLAGKGWFPSSWVSQAVGIGGTLAVALWSYYSNSINSVVTQAAGSPLVKSITTTPGLANEIPSPKVTS